MDGLQMDVNKRWGKMTLHQKVDVIFEVLCRIDQHGCSYAQKKEKGRIRKLYILWAASGGRGGILGALTRKVF